MKHLSQKKQTRGLVKDCCWQQSSGVHIRAGNRLVPSAEMNSPNSTLCNSQILTTLKVDFCTGANLPEK